jgi:hypothetical protein
MAQSPAIYPHPPLGPCSILTVRSTGNDLSTGPLSVQSPENNHIASVLSHSNTRPSHPNAAIKIPSSAAPTGSIVIQGGAPMVTSTAVMLAIAAVDANGIADMRLRNDAGTWDAWEPLGTSRAWTLAGPEGERVVWVQFRDVAGNESSPYSDSVVYQAPYHVYLPLILRSN